MISSPWKTECKEKERGKKVTSWSTPIVNRREKTRIQHRDLKEFQRISAATLKSKESFLFVSLSRCLWWLLCKIVQIINKSLWAATEKQHTFSVLLDLSGPAHHWFGELLSSDWRTPTRSSSWWQNDMPSTSSPWLLFASSLLQT